MWKTLNDQYSPLCNLVTYFGAVFNESSLLPSIAWPLGAVVSGDPGLLPVWPFLVHLPCDCADHSMGLPHKAERVSEGVAGPAIQ